VRKHGRKAQNAGGGRAARVSSLHEASFHQDRPAGSRVEATRRRAGERRAKEGAEPTVESSGCPPTAQAVGKPPAQAGGKSNGASRRIIILGPVPGARTSGATGEGARRPESNLWKPSPILVFRRMHPWGCSASRQHAARRGNPVRLRRWTKRRRNPEDQPTPYPAIEESNLC